MDVVLTIRESSHGLWCICSGPEVLFDRLHFAHAIRLGRGLAREEQHIARLRASLPGAGPQRTSSLLTDAWGGMAKPAPIDVLFDEVLGAVAPKRADDPHCQLVHVKAWAHGGFDPGESNAHLLAASQIREHFGPEVNVGGETRQVGHPSLQPHGALAGGQGRHDAEAGARKDALRLFAETRFERPGESDHVHVISEEHAQLGDLADEPNAARRG